MFHATHAAETAAAVVAEVEAEADQGVSAPPRLSPTRFKEMLQHNAKLAATGAGSGISVWDLLVMVNMARYGRTPSQAECVCGTAKDGIPQTKSWNVPTFPSFAELEHRITEIRTSAASSSAAAAAPTFPESSLSGAELLQRALLLRGGSAASAMAFDLDAFDSSPEESEDVGLGLTPAEEALVSAAQEELFGSDDAAPSPLPGARFSSSNDDDAAAAFASAAAMAAGDDGAIFWELSEEVRASEGSQQQESEASGFDDRAGLGGGGGLTNDDLVALYRARLEAQAMDG